MHGLECHEGLIARMPQSFGQPPLIVLCDDLEWRALPSWDDSEVG